MTARAIKLCGTDVPDAKARRLEAGRLSVELVNGALRDIRFDGSEVLRGIAYLVRDKNWGTYTPTISGLKVRQSDGAFKITYGAVCEDSEQVLAYDAVIEGSADGRLAFSAIAIPPADFVTNRAGFVVLHPLEGVVGKPVEIVHTDGKRERNRFPDAISPGQPVFDIRSLKHTVVPGVTATVLMEGNKFEMEDHRNWMDASYKTYVCSLLDPWPYTLAKDQPFTQSITLSIAGKPVSRARRSTSKDIAIEVGGAGKPMPSLGTGISMAEAANALEQADLVAGLQLGHLVCQLDGRREGLRAAAEAYRDLKDRIAVPVHLEIILPAQASAMQEMAAIHSEVEKAALKPDAVIVSQNWDLKSFQPNAPRPPGPEYAELAEAARALFPAIPIGGGMLSYFTELNRKRPPAGLFDFITHTVCPIVHAADDVSVMQTLQSLPSIIRSTRKIIGKTPYHIGPSSIACRDNPYGKSVAANPDNSRVCLTDSDPRQRGLFGAAWTLGCLAGLCQDTLAAVAMASATGPQGLIYRKSATALPGYANGKAAVYPAYHVMSGLGRAGAGKTIAAQTSDSSRVVALSLKTKTGPHLWLANLTATEQSVKIIGVPGAMVLHSLDETNFDAAVKTADFLCKGGQAVKKTGTLSLKPYAVLRLSPVSK